MPRLLVWNPHCDKSRSTGEFEWTCVGLWIVDCEKNDVVVLNLHTIMAVVVVL